MDARDSGKTLWLWTVGIVVAIAAIIGLIFVSGGIQRLTANFRGETGVSERTKANADYRIEAYERFFNACASIMSLEDQIAAMEKDSSLPPDQRAANILALQNQRATAIHNYNMDARKEGTVAQFKSSDLPHQLVTDQETSC